MKQTGTFYTLINNTNGTETKSPLPNIYIYFSQNNVRKLTTQTNADGKFDFDLPLGNYNVTMSLGANSTVHTLAGGSEFSLTASSAVNEFEKWAMTPVYLKPEENPLVIRLAELAKIATDAATEAKAIQDAMKSNVIGDGPEYMRKGAGGVLSITNSLRLDDSGLFEIFKRVGSQFVGNSLGGATISYMGMPGILASQGDNFAYISFSTRTSNAKITFGNSEGYNTHVLYSTANTTVDSNGNIKAASPIVKLFNDHIESNDSFKEKPKFEKLGSGVYKITNTPGLSKNGWTHNIPLNSNGRGYFRVRVEHLDDGCIVRVFKIKNVLNPDTFEVDVVDGDPIDIGKDQRWIDLRFHEEQEADDEELLTQLDNLDESAH